MTGGIKERWLSRDQIVIWNKSISSGTWLLLLLKILNSFNFLCFSGTELCPFGVVLLGWWLRQSETGKISYHLLLLLVPSAVTKWMTPESDAPGPRAFATLLPYEILSSPAWEEELIFESLGNLRAWPELGKEKRKYGFLIHYFCHVTIFAIFYHCISLSHFYNSLVLFKKKAYSKA